MHIILGRVSDTPKLLAAFFWISKVAYNFLAHGYSLGHSIKREAKNENRGDKRGRKFSGSPLSCSERPRKLTATYSYFPTFSWRPRFVASFHAVPSFRPFPFPQIFILHITWTTLNSLSHRRTSLVQTDTLTTRRPGHRSTFMHENVRKG